MSIRRRKKPGRKSPANTPKQARRARERAPKKIVARTRDGKFLKGSSGNPSGRPTMAHEIRELAGAHSAEALQTILEIMRDRKRDPSVRLVAAKAVLDRAVGKPMQPIAGGLNGSSSLINITVNPANMNADELLSLYNEVCGRPDVDIGHLIAAPVPAQAAERQPVTIEADPLAPATEAADSTLALMKRLGTAK